MPFDLEEVLARKRPNTATVPIALDPDVIEAHAKAKAAVDVAREVVKDNPSATSRAALADAEEELASAEEAAEQATLIFTFRGLSDPEWSALLDDHAPTKDQVRKARQQEPPRRVEWNEDTFPDALIAACSVEPALTEADVERMRKSEVFNGAEMSALFFAAIDASRSRRVPQLGKGSGSTPS